jgi:hypothetical protein
MRGGPCRLNKVSARLLGNKFSGMSCGGSRILREATLETINLVPSPIESTDLGVIFYYW